MNRNSLLTLVFACALAVSAIAATDNCYQVGVASVDITPKQPVLLSGYAARTAECQEVAQPIHAKALVIDIRKNRPALLITVDNVGVPEWIREELLRRLAKQGVRSDNLAICSSHSHSCPMLTGLLPNLFGEEIPPARQQRIDEYTNDLLNKLESVAKQALAARKPCQLKWGMSKAGFAKNRRTQGGPVDHDVPVLVATDSAGKVYAVFANYACHCTTVTGEFNKICGDWAGYAQEYIERDNPGSVAMISLGCGADSNPFPRPGFELAQKHGKEIADAVNGLIKNKLTPVHGKLVCQSKRINLPFDTLPARAEWEVLAHDKVKYVAYHAQKNLARLDRGEKLPTKLPYLVQTWHFGGDLAMVFLPGEVVVDYSLRLKKEFDGSRLWVNAWVNDVPCYIPSKRILKEGGYEGGYSMIYYDRPAKFAEPVEELIVGAVHKLLPSDFQSK